MASPATASRSTPRFASQSRLQWRRPQLDARRAERIAASARLGPVRPAAAQAPVDGDSFNQLFPGQAPPLQPAEDVAPPQPDPLQLPPATDTEPAGEADSSVPFTDPGATSRADDPFTDDPLGIETPDSGSGGGLPPSSPDLLPKDDPTDAGGLKIDCAAGEQELRSSPVCEIDLNIRIAGEPGRDFPRECTLGSLGDPSRCFPLTTFTWKASALCHKPLYFDDEALERYGHEHGPYLEPIVSGAHFFGTLAILPYKMGLRTPCECVYALGHYRPGSCAPYLKKPLGFTKRAALFQAGAVTAGVLAIP